MPFSTSLIISWVGVGREATFSKKVYFPSKKGCFLDVIKLSVLVMLPLFLSQVLFHHDLSRYENTRNKEHNKREDRTRTGGRYILGKGVSENDQNHQKQLFCEENHIKKVVQFL